mmetsp:Transcript_703/g.1820  ORF Transcript_703/g.1820 Transcript_703/m.1820 type:complete len:126 (-) Transcript_703:1000-1377(-)
MHFMLAVRRGTLSARAHTQRQMGAVIERKVVRLYPWRASVAAASRCYNSHKTVHVDITANTDRESSHANLKRADRTVCFSQSPLLVAHVPIGQKQENAAARTDSGEHVQSSLHRGRDIGGTHELL